MARLAICSAILLIATSGSGQTAPGGQAPETDATWRASCETSLPQPLWRVQAKAEAWYAAPAGEVKLPGSPTSLGLTDLADLNLDSPQLSPAGTLALRRGPWRLSFAGSYIDADGDSTMADSGRIGGVSFVPGDQLSSSLHLTTLEATVGYRLFEARRGSWGDGGSCVVFGVDAFVGARAREFGLDVSGPGGHTQTDEWFGEPIIGADLEVELWKQVSVDLKIDGGGAAGYDDKSVGSGSIEIGFGWRPQENLGVRVGYRLDAVGLSRGDGDDRFEFNGSSAGLILGVELRF